MAGGGGGAQEEGAGELNLLGKLANDSDECSVLVL